MQCMVRAYTSMSSLVQMSNFSTSRAISLNINMERKELLKDGPYSHQELDKVLQDDGSYFLSKPNQESSVIDAWKEVDSSNMMIASQNAHKLDQEVKVEDNCSAMVHAAPLNETENNRTDFQENDVQELEDCFPDDEKDCKNNFFDFLGFEPYPDEDYDFTKEPTQDEMYSLDIGCTGKDTCKLCAKIIRESAAKSRGISLGCMTKNVVYRITSYDGQTPSDFINVATSPLRKELRELRKMINFGRGVERLFIDYYQNHNFMKARIVVIYKSRNLRDLLRMAIIAKKDFNISHRVSLNLPIPSDRVLTRKELGSSSPSLSSESESDDEDEDDGDDKTLHAEDGSAIRRAQPLVRMISKQPRQPVHNHSQSFQSKSGADFHSLYPSSAISPKKRKRLSSFMNTQPGKLSLRRTNTCPSGLADKVQMTTDTGSSQSSNSATPYQHRMKSGNVKETKLKETRFENHQSANNPGQKKCEVLEAQALDENRKQLNKPAPPLVKNRTVPSLIPASLTPKNSSKDISKPVPPLKQNDSHEKPISFMKQQSFKKEMSQSVPPALTRKGALKEMEDKLPPLVSNIIIKANGMNDLIKEDKLPMPLIGNTKPSLVEQGGIRNKYKRPAPITKMKPPQSAKDSRRPWNSLRKDIAATRPPLRPPAPSLLPLNKKEEKYPPLLITKKEPGPITAGKGVRPILSRKETDPNINDVPKAPAGNGMKLNATGRMRRPATVHKGTDHVRENSSKAEREIDLIIQPNELPAIPSSGDIEELCNNRPCNKILPKIIQPMQAASRFIQPQKNTRPPFK